MIFLVELHGYAREVYQVEADNADEAIKQWTSGILVVSEASGMEIESVHPAT